MKGYVLNTSPMWAHVLKRSVGPGSKIQLSDLYEQYGKKHGLVEGDEFVEWLRTIKLTDTNRWKIVLESEVNDEKNDNLDNIKMTPQIITTSSTLMAKDMGIKDIVSLSVRKAREEIPKIKDLKLLKYSIQEANQFSGKDSLCRLLRKRITELEAVGR